MDLNTIWFLLIGVLFTGYAILDGFDLGVGALSLFAKDERERRLHLASIGPVWDGNEVWLLTAGGALFAAFPAVYATVFSGFYLALILLLVALIFRAVSLEFYGKVDSPAWRAWWGRAFGLGSLLPCILLGVAFGNILRGIPIDAQGQFVGSFLGLLNPYAVLMGLLTLALLVMHGAIYLGLKTDGALQDRMRRVAVQTWLVFAVLYVVATLATWLAARHLFANLGHRPLAYVAVIVVVLAIPGIHVFLRKGRLGFAFCASAVSIAGMMALAGLSLFPNLAPSILNPAHSLTVYNASSTPGTLTVMLVIALIAVPIVLAYTAFIYWVFRGKAEADGHY